MNRMIMSKDEITEYLDSDRIGSVIADQYTKKEMEKRGIFPKKIKLVKTFFDPKEKDLQKLMEVISQFKCETVLDVGCGSGIFLNKLATFVLGEIGFLIKKMVYFKGIDTRFYSEPLPDNYYRHNVSFEFNGIEAMAYADERGKKIEKFDCVICAWMPYGSDWREMMCKLSNKLVVLILSKNFNTATTVTYTGCGEFGFEFVKSWSSGRNNVIQVWKRVRK